MTFMNFEKKTWKRKFLAGRTEILFSLAALVSVVLAGLAVWLINLNRSKIPSADKSSSSTPYEEKKMQNIPSGSADNQWSFIPGPISMDLVKKRGCVTDGFLSGYGGKTEEITKMINRSECVYLHRALETWLKPPDFEKAFAIMQGVDKKQVIYGMFIAEAIAMNREYEDSSDGNRVYRFEDMCREGTEDRWGANTCIPSIQNVNYRRYLRAMTRQAMDLGIQSFLFGQIELQDEQPSFEKTEIKKVIDDMRKYAKEKGIQIIIGGQTNDIIDGKYLKFFDYIEGGVGIDSEGNIESGACFSRYSSCWGLLWNKEYSSKANNVLLHLDWSGLLYDDMGIFAKMTREKRGEMLDNLYQKFTSQKMGFLMPFLAVINHENGGCYGPNKHFYAPSNKFRCKDEDAINLIMQKKFVSSNPE